MWYNTLIIMKKEIFMPIKYIVYLFFFFSNSLFAETASDILKNIPKNDQESLQKLFEYLIDKGHLAYTLFGDKPVSFTSLFVAELPKISFSKKNYPKSIFSQRYCICNAWNTWKKYKSLFPITKYIFIEEISQSNINVKHIFLINKELFVKKVNDNLVVFQQILGKQITGEYLIASIEQSDNLRSMIHQSEILLGILLGYGKHNSKLYQKREDISISYKQYKQLLLKDSLILNKLDQKANVLTEILQPFGESHSFLQATASIEFVADTKHPETIHLKRKYKSLRNQIARIYAEGNVLEITLAALLR